MARTRLEGRLALQFVTNSGIADFRTRRLLYVHDLSRDDLVARYEALDPSSLRDAARRTWGGGESPEPTAIEVLPARGFGKVIAALRYLLFRRL